jgi:peptidoglycan/xylan/chitin deacetylase (PgdA/CDA1 family)
MRRHDVRSEGDGHAHRADAEISLPHGFRWPDGKRIAVFFNVAHEGWSEGRWPGIGPMGNPLAGGIPDTNALSWGEYGHRRGIDHILGCLGKHEIKANVMVCGVVAETHPESIRAIAEAGHDIVSHSYGMDIVPVALDEAAEAANIARTTELIVAACGVRPRGWISPRATPSPRSSRLLAEAGYEWHGDFLNDDLPYVLRFGSRPIVAFPLGMDASDLPILVRHGHSPRAMLERVRDTLEDLRQALPGQAVKLDVTVHAHVFGRPACIAVYDRIADLVLSSRDVWLGTRDAAVRHVRTAVGV